MTSQKEGKVCRSATVQRLLKAAATTLASAKLKPDDSNRTSRAIQALGIKLTSAEAFFQNRDCGCASAATPEDLRFACTSEALAAEVLLAIDGLRDKLQRRKQRLATALEQCQIAERLAIHPQQQERGFELHTAIGLHSGAIESLYRSLPAIRGRALTCLKQATGPAESPLLSRAE